MNNTPQDRHSQMIGRVCREIVANAFGVALSSDDEEWRECPGYEGRYEVSSLGRIRSLPRTEEARNGVSRSVYGGILKPMVHTQGYLQVSLRKKGQMRTVRLHRLIAEAFHGRLRNALHNEVAHLDGNPSNARADNLKWVSKVENHSHKLRHGTHHRGSRHPGAKLTEEQALAILTSNAPRSELAEQYSVSAYTIDDIRSRKRWPHLHRLSQVSTRDGSAPNKRLPTDQ
jgi:hypothetical protein